MTHDEIIEVMADASRSVSRRDLPPDSWLDDSEIRDMMESALSALESRGMVVVPTTPSEAMLEASTGEIDIRWGYADPDFSIAKEMAGKAYRAMLAAKE